MAYWEFLLQKEGDHDWLPLETAHVEISEGRYRIIAHTSYCEIPVDIRLSRLLTNQMPPKRKTLKRYGQTNQNGLMAVIPFTHLTPGSWTVTCSAIEPANTAPEVANWKYGVQLQVLAIESGVEYWDTESDEAAIAEQLTASSPSFEAVIDTTAMEQLTASDKVAQQPDPASTLAAESIVVDKTPLEDLPLRLQLQHQALVAQSQATVTLQGQMTTFSQIEGLPQTGTLWAQLKNPETNDVVHEETRTVPIAALPCRFEMPLVLPEQLSTRLLVGELTLWTAAEPPQILAIQGFTITLNLDALLEVVANQAEKSPIAPFDDSPPLPSQEHSHGKANAISVEGRDLEGQLSSLSPREIPFRRIYLPSTGLTLPPVIYRPIDQKNTGTPSLPFLENGPNRSATEAKNASPASPPEQPLSLPPLGPSGTSPLSVEESSPSTEVEPQPAVELPAFGRSPQTQPLSESSSSLTDESAEKAKATGQADFQPDFQSRFWNRLSAIAEEAQKAAADRKAHLEAAGVSERGEETTIPGLNLPFPDLQDESGTQNYEVVVYEPEESTTSTEVTSTSIEASVEVLPPTQHDLESDIPVPLPQITLPLGDLVAGAALPITVKLPTYPRRLAVKVWLTDIQSRTVLDRPRWLMSWTPTYDGEQTAFLQLQVPMGSVEVRFEAIAIDLATQRESYKTTLSRTILPTSLPSVSLEDPF